MKKKERIARERLKAPLTASTAMALRIFAGSWPDRSIVQEVLAQITLYHNLALLGIEN